MNTTAVAAEPSVTDARALTLIRAAFQHARGGDVAELRHLLLDGGAQVDGTGPDGKTALMFAAMFDRVEVVDLLLARGASAARL